MREKLRPSGEYGPKSFPIPDTEGKPMSTPENNENAIDSKMEDALNQAEGAGQQAAPVPPPNVAAPTPPPPKGPVAPRSS